MRTMVMGMDLGLRVLDLRERGRGKVYGFGARLGQNQQRSRKILKDMCLDYYLDHGEDRASKF